MATVTETKPKTKKAKAKSGAPEQVKDLRGALEFLRAEGDLIETDQEVDPDLELTGLQKQFD
ncbi:MAG: hypothetical protein V3S59_07040, partial [Alphaproteobacteria bacterium]